MKVVLLSIGCAVVVVAAICVGTLAVEHLFRTLCPIC